MSIELDIRLDSAQLERKLRTIETRINSLGSNIRSVDLARSLNTSGLRNGMRGVNTEMSAYNSNINRAASKFNTAFNVGTVIAAAAAIASVSAAAARAADTITNMGNSLRAVGLNANEVSEQMRFIAQTASRTRIPLNSVSDLFTRMARSTADMDVSTSQIETATTATLQAFQLSGASAAEASSSVIQLSQGLASGALRGDELRSVLEGAPLIARAIADELGVAVGELRDLGAEGRITSDIVFSALLNSAEDFNEQFEQLSPTFEQAFQVLRNGVTLSAGTITNMLGDALGIQEALIRAGQRLTDAFASGTIETNFAGILAFIRIKVAELKDLFASIFEFDAERIRVNAANFFDFQLPSAEEIEDQFIRYGDDLEASFAEVFGEERAAALNEIYQASIRSAFAVSGLGSYILEAWNNDETIYDAFERIAEDLEASWEGVGQRIQEAIGGVDFFPVDDDTLDGIDERVTSFTTRLAEFLGADGELATRIGTMVGDFVGAIGGLNTLITDAILNLFSPAETFETPQWLVDQGAPEETQRDFVDQWVSSVQDSLSLLKSRLLELLGNFRIDFDFGEWFRDLFTVEVDASALSDVLDDVSEAAQRRLEAGDTAGVRVNVFEAVVLNIRQGVENIKSTLNELFNLAIGTFEDSPLGQFFLGMIGVLDTAIDRLRTFYERMEEVLENEGAREALGIQSPRETVEEGLNGPPSVTDPDILTPEIPADAFVPATTAIEEAASNSETALTTAADAITTSANQSSTAHTEAAGALGRAAANIANIVNNPANPVGPRENLPTIEQYATGGYISGPGTGTSDSIPAMLSNGEYVIRAAAVRRLGTGFMNAINRGVVPQFFNQGGLVEQIEGNIATSRSRIAEYTSRIASIQPLLDEGSSYPAQYETYVTLLEEEQARLRRLEASLAEARLGGGAVGEDTTSGGAGGGSGEDAGREAGESYANQVKSGFNSALKQFFRTGDVDDLIHGILDTFTGAIIDSVVDGFTESLFGDNGPLNNLFENMFNFGGSIGSAATSGLEGGISETATQALSGFGQGGGFLSGIFGQGGLFSNLFQGIGSFFSGIFGGGGGGLFSGIGALFGFNEGGIVPAVGTSRTDIDSVPAMLTPGELVVPADKVDSFLGGGAGGGSQQTFNIHVTGNIDKQTRANIIRMLPEITQGVNSTNRENNFRGRR